MHILVTGGAGFLGFHLCEALLAQGHQVHCLDNLVTGQEINLQHLKKHQKFEFIYQDICVPLDLEVDAIYNLACPASPIHYQKAGVETIKTSVFGTLNCLELAERRGIKVIQASTSEIYGDPQQIPQSESYWGYANSFGPRACYDEGKRCAEALCYEFKQRGVDVAIARIFNTYGPYMALQDGRVVSNFIVQALKGEPITLYGDGTQTRSFCYIEDMIEGLICFMNASISSPINLGNPNEITMLTLAQMILDLTQSSSPLVFKPLPQDDPCRRCPDIRLAKEQLDWTPKVSLSEGLSKTIDFFRKLLSNKAL